MKKYLLSIFVLFLFSSFLQNSDKDILSIPENEILTFVFAGDIMGHSPQYKAAYNVKTNTFNYDICFKKVKKYIESADFAVANLEIPLAGKPYSGYPSFSSPDAILDGLKFAGYDIIQTANNHVLDRGKKGLERTIRQIEKRNLLHIGSYTNSIQRASNYPLIVEKKGMKIAILNCTYGTNLYQTTYPNRVNYIDTLEIIHDIEKAAELGADFKIMTIHWGTEYETASNEEQRKLAQFFVNQGINLIVGSHPHVIQNAEILYDRNQDAVPVYYSVGNSLSNQRNMNTDGGIMVKVSINCNTKKIISNSYLPVYVHKGYLNGKYQFHLIPTADFIMNPLSYPINASDSLSLIRFDTETRKRLSNFNISK